MTISPYVEYRVGLELILLRRLSRLILVYILFGASYGEALAYMPIFLDHVLIYLIFKVCLPMDRCPVVPAIKVAKELL